MYMYKVAYYFLAHLTQPKHMSNPVNESAYLELRSDYLSPTTPTAVVGTHNEVSVMIIMSTLTEHDLINYYRNRKIYIMLISITLLIDQLLLHLLNQ